MPNNTEFVDESKRLTDSPKKVTEEGKKKSRLIKLTAKSKKALVNAVNKRLQTKIQDLTKERADLVNEYNEKYFDLDKKLHAADALGTKSFEESITPTIDSLETINVRIINLDKKIKKLNSRLIVEGKKAFNIKNVTFSKIVSSIKQRKKVHKLPEKYEETKNSIDELVYDGKYHTAQKELTDLYNFANTMTVLSNVPEEKEVQPSVKVEGKIESKGETTAKTTPTFDINNFDFSSLTKNKDVKTEPVEKAETPVENAAQVSSSVVDSINKELDSGFASILADINAVTDVAKPVITEAPEAKKVPIVAESSVQRTPEESFEKFMSLVNDAPKQLSEAELIEERIKKAEAELEAAKAAKQAILDAEKLKRSQVNIDDIKAMLLEGKSYSEISSYYSGVSEVELAMAIGKAEGMLHVENQSKKK